MSYTRTDTHAHAHTKRMDPAELLALRARVMANLDQHTVYNMPVRPDGCLDNRSMLKIKCDACGEHIDPEEWLVCMPCGDDLHKGCAEWRLEGQNCWDKTRTIHYSERMEEYMQERFRNGQARQDLEPVMSALKIKPVPMAREPRMATLEPVVE